MHFKKVCPWCDAIVAQCRCPSPDKRKEIAANPCRDCIEKKLRIDEAASPQLKLDQKL
jgi:hypothetical protein